MTVFVADIASYQAGLVPAALAPVCVALEIKCTQGVDYVDPAYAGWLTAARAAGLIPVPYHYLDGSDPAAQAAWLTAHILDASLPVMLDFETGGLPHALDVTDAMITAGLHPRLLYLARSRWAALGSPDLAAPLATRHLALINAAYPSNAAGNPTALYPGDHAPAWDPYGGVTPALWQFTDAALLGGQRLDMNAFRGDGAQLAALLGDPPPRPPVPNPVAGWPTQREGAIGWWTSVMQRATMLAGCEPGPIDGRFGPDTLAALRAAQRLLGTADDGTCGPDTWALLAARTLTVQRALARIGLGAGGLDAIAGPLTAGEVRAAQARFALTVDGLVGPDTSSKLAIAPA